MIHWIWKWFSSTLLDFLFPTYCCVCKRLGPYLCAKCYDGISFMPFPVQLRLEKVFLDQVIAVTEYESPIPQLLHQLKYESVIGIAEFCAQLTYHHIFLPPYDLITAVPLHPKRQYQRGFNQSQEIARHLASLTNLPFAEVLVRTRLTSTQAKSSSRAERLSKLENAFSVDLKNIQLPKPLTELTVMLIDDVTTTGTTLNECAKVLKQAGCPKVIGLVIAHGS